MKKNKNVFLIVLVSLVILMIVPSISAEATNNEHKNGGNVVDVPERSRLVDLGNGIMRYDQVHYSTDNGWFDNNAITDPDGSINDYLLMGAKWRVAEPFVINPTGYAENDMQSVIETSLNTWDNEVRKDIFGDVIVDVGVTYSDEIDSKNTVTFSGMTDDRVIAFASTWYTIRGRRIVESDVVFNTHFVWGDASIDADKMDLQNIATHEFGHSAGLLDLYRDEHSELTMFGESDYDETNKRTLEAGDIAGIHAIYGV